MKATLTSIKPLSLMIASVAVASTAAMSLTLTGSDKASFTLSASPASASVTQGQTATYSISEQVSNGFAGAVGLSVTGLPAGVTASFGPNPMAKGSTTSTMAVTTATTTPPGASTLTVTGTSGSITSSATVTLTVNGASASPTFSVTAAPPSRTMLPGDAAQYTVTVSRQGATQAIALTVSGLPSNSTGSFSPASLPSGTTSSSLTVTTKNNTPSGLYNLVVSATVGNEVHTASVALNLASSGKSFSIGLSSPIGDVSPGTSSPINLSFTNPNTQPLTLTNMTVSLQSVAKSPSAPANRPCGISDFAVNQYSGSYTPLVVPATNQPVSLSSLVSDSSVWPSVKMNDPDQNQDGCKGATLTFAFTGAGQG